MENYIWYGYDDRKSEKKREKQTKIGVTKRISPSGTIHSCRLVAWKHRSHQTNITPPAKHTADHPKYSILLRFTSSLYEYDTIRNLRWRKKREMRFIWSAYSKLNHLISDVGKLQISGESPLPSECLFIKLVVNC